MSRLAVHHKRELLQQHLGPSNSRIRPLGSAAQAFMHMLQDSKPCSLTCTSVTHGMQRSGP